MNFDPALIAILVCALAAVGGFAWAILERRRADRAQTAHWELRDRSADAEDRQGPPRREPS
uniref:hypothetical protein n=1 Tax=Phenylobacterium sp. TaxID=1871053 RepID=UPI0035C85407